MSIKEIVARSPWKTPDKTLFLGTKTATFLALDIKSGQILHVFNVNNGEAVPEAVLKDEDVVLVGRTGVFG